MKVLVGAGLASLLVYMAYTAVESRDTSTDPDLDSNKTEQMGKKSPSTAFQNSLETTEPPANSEKSANKIGTNQADKINIETSAADKKAQMTTESLDRTDEATNLEGKRRAYFDLATAEDLDREAIAEYLSEQGNDAFFSLGDVIDRLARDGKRERAAEVVSVVFQRLDEARGINEYMKVLAALINSKGFDIYQEVYDRIAKEQDTTKRQRLYSVLTDRDLPKKWRAAFINLAKNDKDKMIQFYGNNWDKPIGKKQELYK